MRIAYADPPYVGVAHRYPENTEVDHGALIAHLEADYPDGWALSAKSNSLKLLLDFCQRPTRVGAWVKPFAIVKHGIRPAYAWEPVLFQGGRKIASELVLDWHLAAPTMGQRVLGAKPESFCYWVFRMLGLRRGDELVDVFPGSGAVGRAWQTYTAQIGLPLETKPAHSSPRFEFE